MEQTGYQVALDVFEGPLDLLLHLVKKHELSILLVLNVFLAVFNLLPLPPLDGAAVLNGLLPERHAVKLMDLQSNAMMSMVGLVIAWRVFPLVTHPLFSVLLRLVHPQDSYS